MFSQYHRKKILKNNSVCQATHYMQEIRLKILPKIKCIRENKLLFKKETSDQEGKKWN